MDDHHGDGRLALWCACPPGMRDGLVKANSQSDAYLAVAPKKLAAIVGRA